MTARISWKKCWERDLKIMEFLFSLRDFHFVKQKYIYNGERRDDILRNIRWKKEHVWLFDRRERRGFASSLNTICRASANACNFGQQWWKLTRESRYRVSKSLLVSAYQSCMTIFGFVALTKLWKFLFVKGIARSEFHTDISGLIGRS